MIHRIQLAEFLSSLTAEELDALAGWCRAEIAGTEDTPEGFSCFYRLVYGRELPPHAKHEWLPGIYSAADEGKGVIIEAFRGSGKTSTLSVAWVAFKIGHAPSAANLVLQVSDPAAKDTCQ
ncbi:MAG TPA: hypothetical protein VJ965_11755, partial [Anaerolineales bacterium]|nr:hypothetical protein [Anaerolineales bacterium]